MFIIPESISENLWEHNEFLIYLKPFSVLYSKDKSKDKRVSSNILWCCTWMCHPDETKNKYYRINEEERLEVCREFEPSFNLSDPLVAEILDKYPDLCLTLIERSYKEDKDQLSAISKFLNNEKITLANAETIIKLKAQLPKIYADFAKTDKEFEKQKSTQRVFGGRQKSQREKGALRPEK